MKKLLSLLSALTFAGPALAMSLPRYDVETYCDEVASFGGGSSMLRNSCIDLEQDAYNRLKAAWTGVDSRTATHCNEVASFTGAGSYSMLESCIQMEQDAANSPSTFTY